jgi:lipoprotein-releasing system permease protein
MNVKLIRFIAAKFFQGGKRRRFLNFARVVAVVSVMLGSLALIISLSVLNGFEKALFDNAVKFTAHISIKPFNNEIISDVPKVIIYLSDKYPQISAIAPVVEKEALIKTKSYIEGVMIRGYKETYDITKIQKNLKFGTFNFSGENSKEIVLGLRLAHKLGVNIADTVIIYIMNNSSISSQLLPEIDKFKVTGIYETGMAIYDDIYIYAPYNNVANIAKIEEEQAVSVDIILKDVTKIDSLSKAIMLDLGYPYLTHSVFDTHSSIFSWIEIQKEPIPLVLGLISIVAVLNIITILLITVVEKTYSIGVLRALGMNNRGILSIFVFQGTFIGFIGTILGCGIGLLFCLLQQNYGFIRLHGEIYFLDTLPVTIELSHYIIVITLSVLFSFIASIIPSIIAVKVQPVKALKFR